MLLFVGTLRSHKLTWPLFSLIRLRMYFPSGDIATNAALPSSVNLVTVKLRNGRMGCRVSSE